MKETPILFSTPMVQAILEGRKTMTRRIVSKNNSLRVGEIDLQPKWQTEDILWVRETHAQEYGGGILYKASHSHITPDGKWKPSLFMPKEAARIWLEITCVKVERVQDISEEDAISEGITINNKPHPGWCWMENVYSTDSPTYAFKCLWQKINGIESWNKNPFVWCISFKVLSTTGKPKFKKLENATA
jgi:hypothetical protein